MKKEPKTPYTGRQGDIPVKIQDFFELRCKQSIGGFALLEPGYIDKQKTEQELEAEREDRLQVRVLNVSSVCYLLRKNRWI